MGVLSAGSSIIRTGLLGLAWLLSIVTLILSCLVAANGHWKPRAVSIWTAIVSCLTILTLPLVFLGKFLGRFGGRCPRMWELILTGLWLASWVWMATQLNKFHCNTPNRTWTEEIVSPASNTGSNVGFSLYGHSLTPQGAPRQALEGLAGLVGGFGQEKALHTERALGHNGIRRYARRCRVFKALLGLSIPIFAILALDCLAHMWRYTGYVSRSASVSSVSSVSSVGSPRVASAAHPGAAVAEAENKV
ncbi:hypothetical protein IW140_003146 [Coemansia sp. RSA 1813]|nr:hypothetical protein EV178_003173 [Coemansia sp. RSA 1646]KAJ1773908.1 hypothetical protein LPJ74_000005 [Coemansia sp. RSA 1843]KAJ2089372.1 hypothetical protein IW138_003540 [Coemansia sp. RSA 986]KAJ2214477.1 hypothetical protein EV179_003020 [Coemansia sp. RSA 487]KAJ2569301.1 hypothetical protein IW140_003146 [Coemansia sp. RSA 1813]